MGRKFYIDRLRIFLTILVIFHHTAIAFGASGGWYYVVEDTVEGLESGIMSLCMAVDQSYFMSFFFLISAFFMPTSYDRKGFGKFISDRLLRLGVPLLTYTFIINPLLIYCIYFDKEMTSVWECFNGSNFGMGPLWFVFTLLVFEFSYALYRKLSSKRWSEYFSNRFPSTFKILTFIVLAGLLAFAIRLYCPVGTDIFGIQLGFFSLYVFMYFVGILACRKGWFDKMTLSGAKPWFVLAILGVFVVAYKLSNDNGEEMSYSGGMNTNALFYAMWEPWMCVGVCYFLLAWTRDKFNSYSQKAVRLSSDSFTAYIIHSVMVVGMTFVVDMLAIDPVVKIGLTTILAVMLAFGVSDVLRKIPFLKRIV